MFFRFFNLVFVLFLFFNPKQYFSFFEKKNWLLTALYTFHKNIFLSTFVQTHKKDWDLHILLQNRFGQLRVVFFLSFKHHYGWLCDSFKNKKFSESRFTHISISDAGCYLALNSPPEIPFELEVMRTECSLDDGN